MRGPLLFRERLGAAAARAAVRRRGCLHRGFSLLELLMVLGVMVVLGGLLLPATRAALAFGRTVQTKAAFTQWAAGAELYRAEYGEMPVLSENGILDAERLAVALTGRDTLGRDVADERLNGNVRRRCFVDLDRANWLRLDPPREGAIVLDAFGNGDIAVLYDRDGDGWIRANEELMPVLRSGNPRDGYGEGIPLAWERVAPEGAIRARILFVSLGGGGSYGALHSDR